MSETLMASLGLETKEAEQGLKKLERDVNSFSKSFNASFKSINTSTAQFVTGINQGLEIIGKGFAGVSYVVGKFNQFFGELISEASSAEVSLNNMNQALIRTGQYTPQISKDLEEFSTQIQNTSIYSDDMAQSSIALLASLTKLDADGLKKATQASVDLASAINVDLETAVRMVGKSANGEIGTFKRYGISIQQGNTDAETFANTLLVLSKNSGAGAGQVTTFSGSMERLKNVYGDFQEQLGNIIVKNPKVVETINQLSKALIDMTKVVAGGGLGWKDFVEVGILTFFAIAEPTIKVIEMFVNTFRVLFNVLTGGLSLIPAIFATIGGAIASWLADVTKNIPVIGTVFAGMAKGITSISSAMKNQVSADLKDIGGIFEKTFKGTTDADNIIKKMEQARKEIQTAGAEVKAPKKIAGGVSTDEDAITVQRKREMFAEIENIENQYYLASNEAEVIRAQEKQIKNEEELALIQSHEQTKLELQMQYEQAKVDAMNAGEEKTLAQRKLNATKELAQQNLINKQKADSDKNALAMKESNNQAYLTATSNFLNAGLMLAKENSAEQKVLQSALAVINTYAGASLALKTYAYNPPLASVMAGSIIAMGLAQVAKINAQKFAMGGIVGGNSMSGDKVPALVNSGEMILNRQQQTQLFNDINSGGNNSSMIKEIIAEIKSIPIVVQANGREIARLVRDERNAGFAF